MVEDFLQKNYMSDLLSLLNFGMFFFSLHGKSNS